MTVVAFNKPFRVLSHFRKQDERATLGDFIATPGVYPAGRLDYDSEGLLLLTDDGRLQLEISHPRFKLPKTYLVQVENIPEPEAIAQLRRGVRLKDGIASASAARLLEQPPALWARDPPIRVRKRIPTAWLQIVLHEGRNRQLRRMTAAVGHPALRIVRTGIGPWSVVGLAPGGYRTVPDRSARQKLYRFRREGA